MLINQLILKVGSANFDYYQSGSKACIKLTPNATAYNGRGYYCNSGYIKSNGSCVREISVPPNAYASGSGWKCNPGFEKKWKFM